MSKHRRLLWFLFGLGSQLQLFGTSLCFTEVFVYLAAPILFTSEWTYMKRNGITTFFWLAIGVMVNGALSCLYNHSPAYAVIRGMAVVCLLPCAIVVSHWMLRKDMANFKWWLVGAAFSELLCTFVFRRSVDVSALVGGVQGVNTTADIMNGPIWLIKQLNAFVLCIPKGWYLQCPIAFAVLIPLGLSAHALLTTVSGRSSALGSMGAALFVILGGKKPSQIRRRVCNRFGLIVVAGILAVAGFKFAYKTAATSGWLGEGSQTKYEKQTKRGEDVVSLLLGGRMESFCGLIACVDQPLIGFGPWAIDTKGYTGQFLSKYATANDYNSYQKERVSNGGATQLILCHAYITEFWLWYGIMGLLFWIYVIYALIRYLKQDCFAVPQWYMWLAASIPSFMWGVFFSPFAARVGSMMFIVAVLMVRAVRKGMQPLPVEMIKQIREVEAK